MEAIRSLYQFITANAGNFVAVFSAVYAAAEVITRLTPTTTDETLLHKVGNFVKKVLDMLGIKNNIKVEAAKEVK